MPNLNVGFVLAMVVCVGDAFGVSTDVGNNAGVITEIECSQYDSQASGYVSVYNNATDFTATSHTYANDFAYFKRAYCGTATAVQAAHCYIVSREGVAKSKVVVADCAQGLTAKIYFVQSGGAMVAGTLTSLPTTYDTYVSFVAACDQCSGTATGSWTSTGAPTGYQIKTSTTTSSNFCNICKTTSSNVFRCASGYYGPLSQTSPTGCTKCTTSSAITATSTVGSNTAVSSCSFMCASGYYGTATSATAGCTACPTNATCAGGNGSTFVCASGYFGNWDTSKTYVGCFACPQNATCTEDDYTCLAGYYANAAVGTNYTYSCTNCPAETFFNPSTSSNIAIYAGQMYGPLAARVAYDITDCYVPKNAYYPYQDSTGQFKWSEDCHYSN